MIVVVGFVTLIGTIALSCAAFEGWNKKWLGILSLVVGVLLIAGEITLGVISCDTYSENNIPLYAGYNNSEINAHFFLGSGSINDTDMVYFWIDQNGVKSKHEARMSDSVFIEDGKNTLVLKETDCKDNLHWLFICDETFEYEFHVPENSIVQMYQYH